LLGVFFFGGFLILALNVIPRQIDHVYCWILLAFLSLRFRLSVVLEAWMGVEVDGITVLPSRGF
jgi:hypothetical protein